MYPFYKRNECWLPWRTIYWNQVRNVISWHCIVKTAVYLQTITNTEWINEKLFLGGVIKFTLDFHLLVFFSSCQFHGCVFLSWCCEEVQLTSLTLFLLLLLLLLSPHPLYTRYLFPGVVAPFHPNVTSPFFHPLLTKTPTNVSFAFFVYTCLLFLFFLCVCMYVCLCVCLVGV